LQIPDARRQVQAGQLADYLNRGGSNRHIADWEADPILMLVKHPQLVVAMPTGAGQVEQRYQVPHPVLPNQTQGRIERTKRRIGLPRLRCVARPTDQATPHHLDAD
jgi:hypothetical protein